MAERLTLKKLSGELEALRTQVLELEQQLEHKLKTALERAVIELGSGIESANLPKHGASIDTEQRQRLIEEEAYLIAEQRGFQGGDPAQDWARAEKQVNHRLMQEDIRGESAMQTKRPATKKARTKPSSRAK
ncbi:MAG: DUF2934 domain-containing protein [Pseudomonadota bacterium]